MSCKHFTRSKRLCCRADLRAPRKRLDALRGTDECRHHEDADRKQHGLQDVRAGVVEPEQDRKRPAAGERRAEHFGTDQDSRADDGDDSRPDDLAAAGRGGLRTNGLYPAWGRNLPEKCSAIKRKRPKKAPSRDISSSIYSGRKRELLMSETLETADTSQAPENPLLKAWQTPFETPPFAEIRPEHFLAAFEQAFADDAAEIAAITHDPSAPDFANTITALERSGKLLSKVSAVFYDLVAADSNPVLLEIDKEVSLRMARHWNPIMMNAVLFGRIAMLHDNRATLALTGEQMRLLERTYTRFHRSGAGLDEAAKARMAEINERLAHLGTAFSHHLLGDEQDWFMELGEADREGLPDSFIAAANAAASERGMEGKAIVTLSRSSVEPLLKSSSRRDLREKAYKAFIARGDNDNANDNNAVIVEILELREESAKLLGFPTFAAFRLEDSMAKTPQAVRGLLERVWKPARARALADRDALQALVSVEGGNFALAPWDWRYYAEKLRQRRANFDDAAIKPYLVLDHMIDAAFDCATRLFGVTFSERKDIPVWHPDVRVWEVKDAAGRSVAALHRRAQIQPGLCHRGIRLLGADRPGIPHPAGLRQPGRAGVRAPGTGKDRHARGNLAAAPAAAIRPYLFRRSLCVRLLQLHVVRGDGCRCLRRVRGGRRHFRPRDGKAPARRHLFVGRLARSRRRQGGV